MENHIKLIYSDAFNLGSKIYEIIAKETGIDLYKSERFYIVLHVKRLGKKSNILRRNSLE